MCKLSKVFLLMGVANLAAAAPACVVLDNSHSDAGGGFFLVGLVLVGLSFLYQAYTDFRESKGW